MNFWYRRTYKVAALIATAILALYLYGFFTNASYEGNFPVISTLVLILTSLTLVASLIFTFWSPQKPAWLGAPIVYLLLITTVISLIITTGGIESLFLPLWPLTVVLVGSVGLWSLAPIFISIIAYIVYQYLNYGLSSQELLVLVITGVLPIFLSYLFWHRMPRDEDGTDQKVGVSHLAQQHDTGNLLQSADSSEAIIDSIGDGVIAIDGQGIVRLINPAAEQLLGWSRSDAIGLDYMSILKLRDKQGTEPESGADPIYQVLNNNQQIRSDDFFITTSSDKKKQVSLVVSPIAQSGNGAIIVFRDITNQKAAEREQAEFISTASHEMRTPVAAIEGYLGLALNPNTATIDARAQEYIQKAHESSKHLGRLFQDLLDVSKADDGRLPDNPKVVDVVALTRDVVEGLRPQAVEKNLSLIFKPVPDADTPGSSDRHLSPVFYVNLDNDHIREIVANLVENGIKYTEKGEVSVDVTGDDERVIISVSDTGIGIPAEDISHLFQKFYRVDDTFTREIGGTGLGLYLSRKLAEGMGGRIWVESKYKSGSTFFVELPRISGQEASRLIEQQETRDRLQAQQQPPAAPPPKPRPVEPVSVQDQPATPISNAPEAPTTQAYPSQQPKNERTDKIYIPNRN